MVIDGKFFKLIPVNEHSVFFDLELLYDVGGKNPRKEYKIAGYGLTLEHAINKAVCYAVSKKFGDQTITLKQYINELKSIKDDIKKILS